MKPCKKLTHLGFQIDSESMTVTLPDDKVNNVIQLCQNLASKSEDTIRNVAQVIGTLCFPAVRVGPLYYRESEFAKDTALKLSKGNFDAIMIISDVMKEQLSWWEHSISTQSKPIIDPNPDKTLTSDASKEGWGGTCGEEQTRGRWGAEEKVNHINYLELLGAFFVLKSYKGHCNHR